MREVQERGEKVIRLDLLARKHALNDRQRTALRHAVEYEGLTLKDFIGLFKDAPRRTLQRELKGMVDKGLLTPEGATNKLRYRPAKGAA